MKANKNDKTTSNLTEKESKNYWTSFCSYFVTTTTVLTGIVIALTGVVLIGVIGIDKQGQLYLGAFNIAFAVYWLVRANTRNSK